MYDFGVYKGNSRAIICGENWCKHRSAKAKAIREPEETHVFPVDEDNYDDSLAKQ